ncbi:hypothetical protein NQZ68_026328 [Dissostichus eleginoides]|nr:hypothetical protein NQZ68_026328 [Dissostichus eleginoides]
MNGCDRWCWDCSQVEALRTLSAWTALQVAVANKNQGQSGMQSAACTSLLQRCAAPGQVLTRQAGIFFATMQCTKNTIYHSRSTSKKENANLSHHEA